jgi:hypothetical protein
MTATSIGRILLPSVALVAGCVAALLFDLRREPAFETSTAPAASTQPASVAPVQGSLTSAEARAAAAAAEPAISPGSPVTDRSVPVFDIARIEPTGDAVFAGRAAPGAIVDLLRNGERLDRVVADPSGQFVIAPLRLPPGSYELTLSARSPDGTLATSKQGVVVALDEVRSNSVAGAEAAR